MVVQEKGGQTVNEGFQLHPISHHIFRRSSSVITENMQEFVNKKRSGVAFIPSSIQRAIPENVPTAYVHTSLGEFKEIPESLQLDSSRPQKKENSVVFRNHNSKVLPQTEDLFGIVNAREDVGINSLILDDPNARALTDDHISQAEVSEINNFPTYGSSSQIQSLPYDSDNESVDINQGKYKINEEGFLPLGKEISFHLVNSNNPNQDDSLIKEPLQEESPQGVIYTSLGDPDLHSNLLNNHNLEDTYYVDYPESDVLNEQHAGHIFNEIKDANEQNTQDEDPPHKTTGTVNQDELVDGNLEQSESPNLQMNIIQEGKRAIIQRLEPTLIFSNVSPYKVETQRFIYPLSPQNTFSTNPQNQVEGISRENSVKIAEKEETKHSITSVNSETFPLNGAIHSISTIQKREQTDELHSFVPSYFGQTLLKSQESQLLPRGRSLGDLETKQHTLDIGFTPGKLEGGFVPSNFFKSLNLS